MLLENVENGNFNSDLFKARLKEVSQRKHLKEIAADCGLIASTLSKKCRGEGLSASDLLIFAEKYGCSIDYLFGLGSSKQITKEPEPQQKQPLRYSTYARFVSDCFISGLYVLDDTTIDSIGLHSDIARYIFKNIVIMYKLLSDDAITSDVYNTWLDGLCNDFDYLVVSPASIQLTVGDDENNTVSFPNFLAWVQIKEPIETLSERDLYKSYAAELELYKGVPFKLSLENLGIAIIKPSKLS